MVAKFDVSENDTMRKTAKPIKLHMPSLDMDNSERIPSALIISHILFATKWSSCFLLFLNKYHQFPGQSRLLFNDFTMTRVLDGLL